MKFIFVSMPYNHEDKNIITKRVLISDKYALWQLSKNNNICISPAAMGHQLVLSSDIPVDTSFETWKEYCYNLMDICSEIHVLTLEGWQYSVGLNAELSRANQKGIPIKYVDIMGEGNELIFII